MKAVESARSGTEATYRASHEHDRTTRTGQPISHANSFQLSNQNPDNLDSDGVSLSMCAMSQNAPDIEKGGCDLLAKVFRMYAEASCPLSVMGSMPSHSVRTPLRQIKIAGCVVFELSREP